MTKTLEKLFTASLGDLYSAEAQFLEAMPKLASAATDPELKKAIERHTIQTEDHVDRLNAIITSLSATPEDKVCQAALGLVKEAEEQIKEIEPGPVLDAAIIASAQKNEHYEICSYGTMVAWAEQLGYMDAASELQKTLSEEMNTDQELSKIAEMSVNAEAEEMSAVGEDADPEEFRAS